MARRIKDTKLDSRTARAKLSQREKPYFVAVGGRLALGYRRGKNARPWVARIYLGAEKYVYEPRRER